MEKKKFIGVTFKCCNVYARIYMNKQGTAYEGVCPGCYKKRVRINIVKKGGSSDRFFETD